MGLKTKIGVTITHEVIKHKARELARSYIMQLQFKADTDWCVHIIHRNSFSLHQESSPSQKLPADFKKQLGPLQWHINGLHKVNNHIFSQIQYANETPVYLDMSTNYTVDNDGTKSVTKTWDNKKMQVTIMLTTAVNGCKLSSPVILNYKPMPNKQLPVRNIVRCQPKGWITNSWMFNRQCCGTEHQQLDAFKGQWTPEMSDTQRLTSEDDITTTGIICCDEKKIT